MFLYRLVQLISSTLCHKDMPYRDKVYQQLVTEDQSEIKVHSSIISYKIEAILLSRALFVLEALLPIVQFSSTRTSKFFKVGGM